MTSSSGDPRSRRCGGRRSPPARTSPRGGWRRTTQSGLSFFVDEGGPVRFVGHNGDQNGFRAYLSLCPDQRAGSLLAFNTETRGVRNDASNRNTAESRIALATDRLCEALAR